MKRNLMPTEDMSSGVCSMPRHVHLTLYNVLARGIPKERFVFISLLLKRCVSHAAPSLQSNLVCGGFLKREMTGLP